MYKFRAVTSSTHDAIKHGTSIARREDKHQTRWSGMTPDDSYSHCSRLYYHIDNTTFWFSKYLRKYSHVINHLRILAALTTRTDAFNAISTLLSAHAASQSTSTHVIPCSITNFKQKAHFTLHSMSLSVHSLSHMYFRHMVAFPMPTCEQSFKNMVSFWNGSRHFLSGSLHT